MTTETQTLAGPHTVWLDEKDKIASFHCVDGYDRKDFEQYDFFIHFLLSLPGRGYRFQ